MKKFFLLILIIIVAVVYFGFKGNNSNQDPISQETSNGSFQPDPSNATFIFDEGAITLSQGKFSRTLAPNSAIKEETALTSIRGYGDINNDNKNDTVAILVQSGGASGVFIYLAGYVSGPVTYKGTNAIFLGDRITPQSISINRGLVTVNYLDRKDGEPFAAEPTVPTQKTFEYKSGALLEIRN